jgi:hypothetical protein
VLEQAICRPGFADDLHVVVQQNVGVVSHDPAKGWSSTISFHSLKLESHRVGSDTTPVYYLPLPHRIGITCHLVSCSAISRLHETPGHPNGKLHTCLVLPRSGSNPNFSGPNFR